MFIGLDLGTSGLRGLLVDANGVMLAEADAAYPVAHPHPGWSEQDPADWVRACHDVCAALHKAAPEAMRAVQGLSISGQMHGATALDAAGTVLRPSILWNDTRSHAAAARLDADPAFRAVTGNIVFPGFTAPKLVWMADSEPDLFARVDTVLLPKDYLGFWLTGLAASDMSDSAGTAWMDVGARRWSAALLDKSGMRADQMPDLFEGTDKIAGLQPERADALGLPRDCVLVAGAGDNAAAACGMGVLSEGQGFVSLGTSGVLLSGKNAFAPGPASAVHTFCYAVPDTWYQMGVVLAATDSLNWLAKMMGRPAETLADEVGVMPTGPGSVRFLPYLSGERTPHNDSALRGGFLNLDIANDRADLTRAVMEGVCFALADCRDALASTGTRNDRLTAIGGGAQSRYWCQLLANVLDLPIDRPAKGEFGAALGAARLAICGVTGASPTDVMTAPVIAETIDPNSDLVPDYAAAHDRYRTAYPAVKALQ